MCGIAGILTTDQNAVELRSAVARMTDAQRHRGPDDAGIEAVALAGGGQLCLGHRRLSILDTSPAGHQPMRDPASGSWIVFNGEIYNHLELRKTLGDAPFRSTSDTETLLRGWVESGPDWIGHLRGIFAFAVYDARRGRLWLVRDHLGVKPLYVANPRPGLWLFASEVRALLASGLVGRTMSAEGLSSYLAFGAVQAPWTMVEGVRSLLPAEMVCFDLRLSGGAAEPRSERYWRPPFGPAEAAADRGTGAAGAAGRLAGAALERLRAVWDEAVRSQLLSDVPLGVFLSGGIDSSAIVATLARLGQRPTTFSIAFSEADFDESRHSRAVARACGTEHRELLVSAGDVLGRFNDALAAYDQPSIDGINTYTISKAVREAGVTVALSGLGGDEVFAGYPSFRQLPRIEAFLGRWPQWAQRLAGRGMGLWGKHHGRLGKVRQLMGRRHGRLGIYCTLRQLYPEAMRAKLQGAAAGRELDEALAADLGRRADATDAVGAVSLLEMALYMQNMLLRDTDQMSMAHALEVRVPLLDHRLVEELARLPGPWKLPLRGQPNKWMVVELAGQLLPREVVERRKMGFVFPWDRWLRGRLKRRVEDHLLDSKAVAAAGLSPAPVARLWRRYLLGRPGLRASDVLCLLHLVAWTRANGITAAAAAPVVAKPGRRGGSDPRPPPARDDGPKAGDVAKCRAAAASGGDRPRILLVTPDVAARTGGIAMVARSLMRLFAEKSSAGRIDYRVISIGGPADEDEAGLVRSWSGTRFRHFRGWTAPFCLHVLCHMAAHADVAVFTHLGPASLAGLLPRRLAPKVVTFLMGREAWRPLRARQRRGLLRSDLVVSISDFTAATARQENPWLPAVRRCYLGIPAGCGGEKDDTRGLPGFSPGPKDILIVGRMVEGEPGKGHEQLIRVMEDVVREAPQARLVIPGGGSGAPRLRELARSSPVAGQIVFTGFVSEPDLRRLYRDCAVFAMPSRQDGFGLVYLEAMRAGKPCVSSNIDGGQEVVAHGKSGFHVHPDDHQALTRILGRLLRNEPLRRRLGENGRKRFEDMFTERHFHQRFWDLLGDWV